MPAPRSVRGKEETMRSSSGGRRGRAASLLAGLVLAGTLAGAASPPVLAARYPASGRWLPRSSEEQPLTLKGERVIFKTDEMRLEIELLDDARRTLFLNSAGIGETDPFSEAVFGWRVFTFLVRVDNTGGEEVQLRPPACTFITKRPLGYRSPCDFLCLRAAADRAGLDSETTKSFLRAILDTAVSLNPGEKISKLLVFSDVPDEFKEFTLDLDGFSNADKAIRFVIPYASEAALEKAAGKKR
jgi:hypothetical protein